MSNGKPDFSNAAGGSVSSEHAPSFGNVRGGAASTEAPSHPAQGDRTYTVAQGDTLSHIARRFYGKASQWPAIYAANRDQLDDPDRILPGQVLRIPASAD